MPFARVLLDSIRTFGGELRNYPFWVVEADPERARIRELPPGYGYPYNLHGSVPADRRAAALSDTVCAIYEDWSIDPCQVDDIEIREPLRSWLAARTVKGDT